MTRTFQRNIPTSLRFLVLATACAPIALALPAAAFAAGQTLEAWTGFAKITGSTPQCAAVKGLGTGAVFVSVFRPKIGSTEPPSYISFLTLNSATALKNESENTAPQMNGSGNYLATTISAQADVSTDHGTYKFSVSPVSVTAATSIVEIAGTINDVSNVPGCSVTFDAVYAPI